VSFGVRCLSWGPSKSDVRDGSAVILLTWCGGLSSQSDFDLSSRPRLAPTERNAFPVKDPLGFD
jgi:hypothetical protein